MSRIDHERLQCPCCGLNKTPGDLISVAEMLAVQFPDIVVTSATRCKRHNAEVGGSSNSGHLPIWRDGETSVAIDLMLPNWTEARGRKLVYAAARAGALGIGYMPDKHALHIDRKPRPQAVALWKQESNGKYSYFF